MITVWLSAASNIPGTEKRKRQTKWGVLSLWHWHYSRWGTVTLERIFEIVLFALPILSWQSKLGTPILFVTKDFSQSQFSVHIAKNKMKNAEDWDYWHIKDSTPKTTPLLYLIN
jgi:hypothetical protein